jgi:peptidyl-prolyl cis-trans isomerase C
MNNTWRALAAVGLTVLAACKSAPDNAGVVARVGDHTLTVDQAVKLLRDQENIPDRADVVKAVANFWADYTLLAGEVAKDSTLKDIDLEPLVRQQLDQQMIFNLRDSVIHVDTAISDAELKTLYEQQAPGVRITASHILFSFPDQATQAQRDSVRKLAESVRKRAVAGEDFATLAREYSQDKGTAAKGGELGSFGRGDLAPPLEKAALALEPGQISDVVESPYGLHIIRLESKTVPKFEEMRDSFRIRVQNERYAKAESTYVAGIEAKAQPKVADDAVTLVKEIAKDPGLTLSRRAAGRPLVSYEGGAVTVGEFQLLLQSRSDQQQFSQSVQQATDKQIDDFLRNLTQRDLLVAEAKKAGLEPSQARVDSLVQSLRGQLLRVAGVIGLRQLDRAPGEALAPAVDRAVLQSLQDILTGAKEVVPLGQIAFQLRAGASPSISDAGVSQVVEEVGKVRAARRAGPAGPGGRGPGAGGTTGTTGTKGTTGTTGATGTTGTAGSTGAAAATGGVEPSPKPAGGQPR